MQASNAFRSTLMQHFAASARSQSRPPLAMMPWLGEDAKKKKKRTVQSHSATSQHSRNLVHHSASSAWSGSAAPRSPSDKTASPGSRPGPSGSHRGLATPAHLASISLSSVAEDDSHAESMDTHTFQPNQALTKARNFQALIQTRRTTNHFDTTLTPTDATFWKDALDRAVACGRRAPNHKRTEAFTFRRMLSPSDATERLAEIAYQITLQKTQSEENAERKRSKWNQVPAFLVAMVRAPDPLYPDEIEGGTNLYQPLDFVPPQTEREMEDYASTAAAIQNVLLSLHAEHIASKWATGPVIQTPAFRQLVRATSCDRIVGLIMVGLPKSASTHATSNAHEAETDIGAPTGPRRGRLRREWDDVLQDL